MRGCIDAAGGLGVSIDVCESESTEPGVHFMPSTHSEGRAALHDMVWAAVAAFTS